MSALYADYSDEELIGLLREGRRDITDYIMEKYKGMVKAKARSMFLLGGDSDDLIQEGMIGLFKAVRDYDSGRDASFSTFAADVYGGTGIHKKKAYAVKYLYFPLRRTGRGGGGGADERDTRRQ